MSLFDKLVFLGVVLFGISGSVLLVLYIIFIVIKGVD